MNTSLSNILIPITVLKVSDLERPKTKMKIHTSRISLSVLAALLCFRFVGSVIGSKQTIKGMTCLLMEWEISWIPKKHNREFSVKAAGYVNFLT